jgi:hypothetical protein
MAPPPSQGITAPEMKLAAGDDKNMASDAMSCLVPSRPSGDHFYGGIAARVVCRCQASQSLGSADRAGRDRVHANASAAPFQRRYSGELVDACLRCAHVCLVPHRNGCLRCGDVEHRRPRGQVLKPGSHDIKGADEIDVYHNLETVGRQRIDFSKEVTCGARDNHIDGAPLRGLIPVVPPKTTTLLLEKSNRTSVGPSSSGGSNDERI